MMATAKRSAIVELRRKKRLLRKHDELGHELYADAVSDRQRLDDGLLDKLDDQV